MKEILEQIKDWNEDNLGIPVAIFVVLLIIILITIVYIILDKTACTRFAELGMETTWNLTTGCLAKHPTLGWMPVDNYFNTINLYVP